MRLSYPNSPLSANVMCIQCLLFFHRLPFVINERHSDGLKQLRTSFVKPSGFPALAMGSHLGTCGPACFCAQSPALRLRRAPVPMETPSISQLRSEGPSHTLLSRRVLEELRLGSVYAHPRKRKWHGLPNKTVLYYTLSAGRTREKKKIL